MPELPEVETIRRDLNKKIIGKPITDVLIIKSKDSKKLKQEFVRALKKSHIKEVERIGKLLIFRTNKNNVNVLVHLKMTGQLIHVNSGKITVGGHSYKSMSFDLPDKHTQVSFKFSNGSKLFFNDMRRFGYIKLAQADEVERAFARFGIEPLTAGFSKNNFLEVLQNRKTNLKACLLNQQLIAGIGNIYADEICFKAGVRPGRSIKSLTLKEKELLHKSIEDVIKKAIKHRGTTFNNYIDSSGHQGNFTKFLKVYGRGGARCKKCQINKIKKIKLAGRGTHFCTFCQK